MHIPDKIPQINTLTIVRNDINQCLHNIYNTNQLFAMRHKLPKDKRDTDYMKSNTLAAMKMFSNFADYHANPNEYDEYYRVNFQKVDVVKVVRVMYERITELVMAEHKINFQLKTGVKSIFVITDVKRLEKILYNLISNSVRHAIRNEDNKITLVIDETDTQVAVSVRDLSGGIMLEEGHNIFEAYKNPATSAICPATGHGLGLAVSLRFAKEMRAELTVTNAPKFGAEFSIFLPRELDLPDKASIVSDICNTFEPNDMLINIYFSDVGEADVTSCF